MASLKIGVFVQNLRLGVEGGLKKAAEIGADGFQVYCTTDEMLPENMSAADRAKFRSTYEKLGLVLSATCCDYSHGFVDEERNRQIIPKVKANIDQAIDLGTSIITTHIGVVPEDENDPVWGVLMKALTEIGEYAEEKGVVLATETGPESGALLRRFLDKIGPKGIAVNFDPANLVMKKFDHMQALQDLAPYIVHTHAKDGRLGDGEVPLGDGDVNFPEYIRALQQIGYDGFYTIERECGDNPVDDVTKALEYLRAL